MIKFYGEPLREIKSKTSNKVLFRFDTKGEFITDDEVIINRALGRFDHIELESKEVGERVKKTYFTPPMTITTNEQKEIFKCKKCNFETDNKGVLMAHYREHKKEE